jgi:hypothetical protein
MENRFTTIYILRDILLFTDSLLKQIFKKKNKLDG